MTEPSVEPTEVHSAAAHRGRWKRPYDSIRPYPSGGVSPPAWSPSAGLICRKERNCFCGLPPAAATHLCSWNQNASTRPDQTPTNISPSAKGCTTAWARTLANWKPAWPSRSLPAATRGYSLPTTKCSPFTPTSPSADRGNSWSAPGLVHYRGDPDHTLADRPLFPADNTAPAGAPLRIHPDAHPRVQHAAVPALFPSLPIKAMSVVPVDRFSAGVAVSVALHRPRADTGFAWPETPRIEVRVWPESNANPDPGAANVAGGYVRRAASGHPSSSSGADPTAASAQQSTYTHCDEGDRRWTNRFVPRPQALRRSSPTGGCLEPASVMTRAWWDDDLDGRARAIRICAACPVRSDCLEDAVKYGDNFDVIRGGKLLKRTRQGQTKAFRICPWCGRQRRSAGPHPPMVEGSHTMEDIDAAASYLLAPTKRLSKCGHDRARSVRPGSSLAQPQYPEQDPVSA
jgi:hypothetical protein